MSIDNTVICIYTHLGHVENAKRYNVWTIIIIVMLQWLLPQNNFQRNQVPIVCKSGRT